MKERRQPLADDRLRRTPEQLERARIGEAEHAVLRDQHAARRGVDHDGAPFQLPAIAVQRVQQAIAHRVGEDRDRTGGRDEHVVLEQIEPGQNAGRAGQDVREHDHRDVAHDVGTQREQEGHERGHDEPVHEAGDPVLGSAFQVRENQEEDVLQPKQHAVEDHRQPTGRDPDEDRERIDADGRREEHAQPERRRRVCRVDRPVPPPQAEHQGRAGEADRDRRAPQIPELEALERRVVQIGRQCTSRKPSAMGS